MSFILTVCYLNMECVFIVQCGRRLFFLDYEKSVLTNLGVDSEFYIENAFFKWSVSSVCDVDEGAFLL